MVRTKGEKFIRKPFKKTPGYDQRKKEGWWCGGGLHSVTAIMWSVLSSRPLVSTEWELILRRAMKRRNLAKRHGRVSWLRLG